MKHKTIATFFIFLFIFSATRSQVELTQKTVNDMVNQIPKLIQENYVLTDKRMPIANGFTQKIRSKKYRGISNPDSLAKTLTSDLRELSNDKHLYVKYQKPGEKQEEFGWDALEKKNRIIEKKQNFGFTALKILDGNIGYLKIIEFIGLYAYLNDES
ncbi:hypothetical protein MTsPCn5_15140 [Croceitalea sp. MTPC5]|uniref:hypothetical protein n=1 Tax=Croceitalea sp. MTPC5 TaxID=3056565 RepID=UPI002B3C6755|nr:hypothetical protein MTsPCn5_15140 [Croceitalea sp. MTPC5]